eukprot:jgi/Botrbrau1/16063/Bobra.7_2s0034.1
MEGQMLASWGTFENPKLEAKFLVYLGRASRPLSLFTRILGILIWGLRAAQTLEEIQLDQAASFRKGKTVLQSVILVAQLSACLRHIISFVQLWGRCPLKHPGTATDVDQEYLDPPAEMWHEVIKYKTHEHEAIVVMVCIMLMDPNMDTATLALYCFIANSLTALLDQITVVSMLKLHTAKALCLVFVEINCHMHNFPSTASALCLHAIAYAVSAVLLPVLILSFFEARLRYTYLEHCKLSRGLLPRYFRRFLSSSWLLTPAARKEPQSI